MDYIKHSIFATEGKITKVAGMGRNSQIEIASFPELEASLPEGSTVKRRRNSDNGVDGRQGGEEEDDQ